MSLSKDYVELRTHSWYSFGAGASSTADLVERAAGLGYPALGLTDYSNLCGALEFSRQALAAGVQPIVGVDLTVHEPEGEGMVSFIAETGEGYANLCRLVSLAHVTAGRTEPSLDARFLETHASGLIALIGAPDGVLARLVQDGEWAPAQALVERYRCWFGGSQVFLELQQHLVHGDTSRNKRLHELAQRCRVATVATNEVWYHDRERARLHDALTAVRLNRSLSDVREQLKVNGQYWLKAPPEMAALLRRYPDALASTRAIGERCTDFSLPQYLAGRYAYPDCPVPPGHDAHSWLRRLCEESAARRYGQIDRRVRERLDEEFDLIGRHGLAGFFLVYHRIVELARECMLELGHGHQETPLEWLPPGRGRGSSVSMLVGYLIGLSHVDPVEYGLTLDRFLSSETAVLPDIDLDFPRDIRERLILRVIEEWGWDHAALAGMMPTYKARGIVRNLGKALGLPADEVAAMARGLETDSVADLSSSPTLLARSDRPGWRDLLALSQQLAGFPKGLAQHPGGMLVSSTPLTDLMPVQPSAIDGRYVAHWDKDSVDDAGVLKIDLLALGALSQMQQAVRLVRKRTGQEPDLSRIDYRDPEVFADLGRGDTVGVFQVESAAQMQTIVRMKPRDIYDLALEVAAVRPGVGANDGVAEFLRRREGMAWEYDHPLEQHALERSLGVIMFQDQVVQLGMDVGGFTAAEADRMRRAFARRKGEALVAQYRERFIAGAEEQGVTQSVAETIFGKFNPHYMFPEGHALAFAFTAYQMGWLRRYHPLEFFVALFNEQPMGFWDLDTLKQDARRLGLRVAHPDVNRSELLCTAEGDDTLRLGLTFVKGVDHRLGETLLRARDAGPFADLSDLLARSGLPREALENLARAGAMDGLSGCADRRRVLWQVGAGYVSGVRRGQLALALPAAKPPAALARTSRARRMLDEYAMLGLCPDGHVMELLRPQLGADVLTSDSLLGRRDGDVVRVAGRVVRRQRPLAAAVFLTLEDEYGLIPLAVWPAQWERLKSALRRSIIVVEGQVSRRDDTLNVAVQDARPLALNLEYLQGRADWR
ncbi:MAG: DNA polymerase III subunit alpha [Chloroflexi bacterium]|nr:DNA polymerase III subunit alpha [Chloroflexota bacterium]MYD48893.1 DNA polymerase III subunit alpha [Chloroflexota bacterium]